MPNFRLDYQTAFVTGAASGIGRAIALGIAASGANVACFDRPGPGLEEAAVQASAAGVKAIAITGDVTDPNTLADAVQRTQDEPGPVFIDVAV